MKEDRGNKIQKLVGRSRVRGARVSRRINLPRPLTCEVIEVVYRS